MKRLMFYCQHVLGIGHLVRSIALIRELALDFEITLVTGGCAVEGLQLPAGIRLVRLPAIETDASFQELRPCDPAASLAEICESRREQLLNIFESLRPDVLVIELYPFGRRQFSFELKPLLKRALSRRTLVACSLRDVLVQKADQARHEERVCELVNTYFDLILVHGDPAFLKLEETFSRVADLQCEVRYTGYVRHPAPGLGRVLPDGRHAIVVSIGGGRCVHGWKMLEAVVHAAGRLENRLPHEFRIFGGPSMPDATYATLQNLARGHHNISLEKHTPDLVAQLEAAQLSISLGGYNTIMEILQTRVPALVYPATPNGDQEQSLRAEKLAQCGAVQLIAESGLEPARLAEQISRALRQPPRAINLNLNGAANSREILRSLSAQHERQMAAAGV